MTLASLWSDLVDTAIELNPAAIRATILSTLDDGLRAARYDGPTSRSSSASSHPERTALNQRPSSEAHDLKLLDESVAAYITAVAEIAARSMSGKPPKTWDEAVKDHHMLAEMDAITTMEVQMGEKPGKWVRKAEAALAGLERIHDRHCPREPSRTDRLLTEDVCLPHARIGEERDRYGSLRVCQGCYDVMRRAGLDVTAAHKDPDLWPSTEMLHALTAMEKRGTKGDYIRARSAWQASLPVQRTA